MRVLLAICLYLFSLAAAHTEVWRCGEKFFNAPKYGTACTPVKSTKLCGVNGNRVLAPYKNGYSSVNHNDVECEKSDKATSPFVHMPPEDSKEADQVKSKSRSDLVKYVDDEESQSTKP